MTVLTFFEVTSSSFHVILSGLKFHLTYYHLHLIPNCFILLFMFWMGLNWANLHAKQSFTGYSWCAIQENSESYQSRAFGPNCPSSKLASLFLGRKIDALELWMIHHTLKAEVIREMITSKCVCGVVWFGMCVGFVCVWGVGRWWGC